MWMDNFGKKGFQRLTHLYLVKSSIYKVDGTILPNSHREKAVITEIIQ
jgi:hypothetical protein